MVIETDNGYNSDYGQYGTSISVGVRKGISGQVDYIANSFVEGRPVRESWGRDVYSNSDRVAKRINESMPYYAELANKYLKGKVV